MEMSITVMLIIITVLVSMASFNNPDLRYKLIMNAAAVNQGQWYRLITSGFIHSSWMHLGFNMFTFYFFGRNVEYIFSSLKGPQGSLYFLAFYILGIIISDLWSVFKYKDSPYYNSLGASGGVAAVVFSSILFFPTESICLYGFICLPGFLLGAFYLIYSYMKGSTFSDNVNHNAHLVGALFGLAFTILLEPGAILLFFEQIADYRPFDF